jgi:hypothetical protein
MVMDRRLQHDPPNKGIEMDLKKLALFQTTHA